jgi:hypothetical protein
VTALATSTANAAHTPSNIPRPNTTGPAAPLVGLFALLMQITDDAAMLEFACSNAWTHVWNSPDWNCAAVLDAHEARDVL